MDRLFKQFSRIYSDDAKIDISFAKQEEQLRLSQDNLKQATQELIRASERLNEVAMGVDVPAEQMH